MLDREVFLDSLRGKLKDDIQMIIYECQSFGKSYLDIEALNKKLSLIQSETINQGLSEDDWLEIVFELCPDVYDKLDFGPVAA